MKLTQEVIVLYGCWEILPPMSRVILNPIQKRLTYEIDTGGNCSLRLLGKFTSYVPCHSQSYSKSLTCEFDTGGNCSLRPLGNLYLMCPVSISFLRDFNY